MSMKIIFGDSTDLIDSINEKIGLIVTSPPYKDCDGFDLDKITKVFQSCYSKLENNSLMFVNFGHLKNMKSRPFKLVEAIEQCGFELYDTIIWVKNHYTPIRGNNLNNLFEYIFVFVKGQCPKINRLSIGIPYKDKSNIGRYSDKDLKCRGNVWFINYETINSKSQKKHPDRFPLQLPLDCIKLSGIKNDSLVLDPFCGSGTTLIAAESLGINSIGIEKNQKYYCAAKNNIDNFKQTTRITSELLQSNN